jgi:hypothetical protein
MLPRIIDSWANLPRTGAYHLTEQVWFDLKTNYPPKSHAEVAKDVAAFANAMGGAIIVGATEGTLGPDYSNPLPTAVAAEVENQVDLAVRDFCRPSPAVHVRSIPSPDHPTRMIVVVNVDPFVEQPVAARHASDINAWRFPIRVGRHTEFIFPELLPMHMDSKARRAKLLLLRVLETGRDFDLFTVPSGLFKRGDIQGPGEFVADAVDPGDGSTFVVRDTKGAFGGQSVAIPLHDVEAVWLQHDGRWAVRIAGRLEEMSALDGSTTNVLTYIPPSTFVVSPLERAVERLSDRVRDMAQAVGGTLTVEQHPRREPASSAIAERAYLLWEERVRHDAPGTADGDWFRARRIVLREMRGD